ncbi:hypothetical protein AAMO2058_000652500 [Amorphochlora amoebiformis]|uniref:VWFA domain-containing protein n=1 Tax=Amorphochlora amoebiformis TaxID=1561963 RepID=A0A7S0H7V9_9EUKA
MPLEAVMVCMDNSEFQRNGDYSPNRLIAQRETINHISLSTTETNMESTVGLLTMGGRATVLCAPTRNLGNLMSELKDVKISGKCDFVAGIKTAQLALKNRQNKNQHPRIIVFVGSPIEAEIKKLTKLGALLKKNSFAVSVINFGKENAQNNNVEKLEAFIGAVNNDGNSHLVNVPPGPHILSDMVVSSPILGNAPPPSGFGGAPVVSSTSSGGGNVVTGGGLAVPGAAGNDPEQAMLAYAMRISMEEARDKEQKAAAGKEESKKEESKIEAPAEESKMELEGVEEDDDEEDDLARAMALSMGVEEEDDEEGDEGKQEEEGVDDEIMEVLKEDQFLEDLIDSTGVQKDDIDIQKILDFNDEDEDKDKDEGKE